ncbi:hypothetical protein BU26DRAFT_565018 [Trematosphaeria pertusa]|uniref:Uncharacterized protein n=1 Tax=Trematosphaeria pertusa TaxID=390896 RepID=A0A6A6IGR6_9PLEO|nr:uncharacterized protein BU26DRAFT_565018 [Trematosphaeria pertusa]KAF2249367.1 hypothetical protein BU26DRAFT_565018 [Trematosphaeria pertusa]
MSATPANKAAESANFWAEKRKKVEDGPAVDHHPADPISPPSPKQDTPMNVFKRTSDKASDVASPTNANSNPMPPNAARIPHKPVFDWADDEDEDMLSEFGQPDQKDIRIQELEGEMTQKTGRIQELEDIVEAKIHRIEDLEGVVEEKDKLLDETKTHGHKNQLYMQELVAEVDEKDRRINQLETELEEKSVRVRELEANMAEKTEDTREVEKTEDKHEVQKSEDTHEVEQPSIPNTEHTEPQSTSSEAISDDVPTPATPPKAATETPATVTPEMVTPKSTPEAPIAGSLEKPTPEPFPSLIPSTPGSFPTPRDGDPVFVTPETIKKAAPVPPAPKLRMGLDMTKYGKKPDPKAAAKPVGKWFTPKRTTKSDAVPSINPNKDIRKMSREERELFGAGPTVSVLLGNETLGIMPKYMLMQCSEKAFQFFTENPNAMSMRFPAGSMDADSAKQHIDWMLMHTHCGRVFSVHLAPEHEDLKNLRITQAARVMGLNNIYVGHFTRQYCDKIRDHMPSQELMALIDEHAYPENDPIFDCLVNNIANQRQRGTLPHAEQFDEFLTKHAKLAAAIKKIEDRFNAKVWSKSEKANGGGANKPQSAKKSPGSGPKSGLTPR